MNKKISVLTLIGLAFATTAFAATTVSLSPASVSVKEGQTFNMTVSVNPQRDKNYTVKLEIKYPADLIEVKSFSFGSNWMALAQPGYDSIDNINGVLIKTAGYPGGLVSNTSFGTVVFKAKKSGNATIQITGNSLALDAGNQNVISGLPVEALASISPIVKQSEPEKTIPQTNTPEQEVITSESKTQAQALIETSSIKGPNAFIAAAGSAIMLGTESNIIGTIILFLIFMAVYFSYSYFKKKKK
jgi:hypothetical protein